MSTTVHVGDMFSGCADCAEKFTGIVLDRSHWSAYDLDMAIVDFAISAGIPVQRDIVAPWDNKYESARWDAESALDLMNDRCSSGFAFYVEDNSLFFERVANF